MSGAICQLRGCRCVLRIEVVRGGATVTICDWCERKRAGLCRDCPRRVYGTVGKAMRCEACARRRVREHDKKHRSDPEVRRQIESRNRKRYRAEASYRERKCARRREWAARNPEKVKRAARRLLLSEGPSRQRHLATQRRHNADPVRAQKKRVQALARYYELHPVRPEPRCAGCTLRLAWKGVGKPPKWCDDCCAAPERCRRRRLNTSITAIREAVA
ncbi:MAG: hypothetical protein JWL61_5302 [Gemmatimonadetes bacterium]|nr:hypothetical protein [Gemmatimonadota bacterium]